MIDLATVVPRPKAIELDLGPEEIDLDLEGAELVEKAVFQGETERVDDKVHIRGTVRTKVRLDCARCLEPVENKLEVVFDAIFVDPADEPDDVELALDLEQLDESIVEEGRIDLNEVVREQILLALPEQTFCREDCKGLCLKCGGNRNLIDCKCEENEIDPRWSALKDII